MRNKSKCWVVVGDAPLHAGSVHYSPEAAWECFKQRNGARWKQGHAFELPSRGVGEAFLTALASEPRREPLERSSAAWRVWIDSQAR